MGGTMPEDRYGLSLSTGSSTAAAYRDGIDRMLSAWPGAAEAFDSAITEDPDFALAHIARARVHSFYQQGEAARKQAALARDLVRRHGTERERSHVETLALAAEGQLPAALASALKHLESWPRDAVVMSLPLGAFGLFAFSGMADHDQARQDLCERHAQHYGEDWWFLSNYGWSMTENGEVAKGRAMTERAFELRRQNAYAAHALLHAIFEDGSRCRHAGHAMDRRFASGDYPACVGRLEGVLGEVARIGGSHAQREIIEDTFLVALIRSGDLPRALLDRRLHRRPSPRDTRWLAAAA